MAACEATLTTSAAGKNVDGAGPGLFVASPLYGPLTQSSFKARGEPLVAGRAVSPGAKVT